MAEIRSDGVRWDAEAVIRQWTPEQIANVFDRTGILEPKADLLAAHAEPTVVTAPGNLVTAVSVA